MAFKDINIFQISKIRNVFVPYNWKPKQQKRTFIHFSLVLHLINFLSEIFK